MASENNKILKCQLTEQFVSDLCIKLYKNTHAKAIIMLKDVKDKLTTLTSNVQKCEDMISQIVLQCRFLRLDDNLLDQNPDSTDPILQNLFDAINNSPHREYLKRTQSILKRDMINFYKRLGDHITALLPLFPDNVHDQLTGNLCLGLIDQVWHPAIVVAYQENNVKIRLAESKEIFLLSTENVARLDKDAKIGDRAVVRTIRTGKFEVGCVAEMPTLRNSFRYLMFFNMYFVEYCHSSDVYMLLYQHKAHDDEDYSHFLEQYFLNFPERPMVRLRSGANISLLRLKSDGSSEWVLSEILRVDCSMMLLKYNDTGTTEWMYRGSPRLQPISRLYFKRRRNHASQRPNHDPNSVIFNEQKIPTARKSGSQKRRTSITPGGILAHRPKLTTEANFQLVNCGKRTRIENNLIEIIPKYSPHKCSWKCSEPRRPIHKIQSLNFLTDPLQYGWVRELKISYNGGLKVEYRAPCGRSLACIKHLDRFLLQTNSPLSVDRFCFDSRIRIDFEFRCNPGWSRFMKSLDITQGKERIPVTCVNQIDDEDPDIIDYQPERLPLDGIPMNTNPYFLEGCQCEDGCRDKTKCACWQKTMEGIKTLKQMGWDDISDGYNYRRLSKCIKSGIIECNARCKCDSRCCNRVVQNGLGVEIQLFKTINKGWGLRTLCDLPEGTFICTYAGHILTNKHANQRQYCDQYFADMDFIESLEDLKEISGPSYRQLLGDNEMYILDGKICGNVGRYFNHSCTPNLYVQNVMVDTYDMRFPWIAFFTSKVIPAGDELCWDYQYDVDSVPGRKVMCRCGTRKCRGRLL